MSIIPMRAEQEFYESLNAILGNQPAEWLARASDQKELLVSQSDFEYYVQIRQQNVDRQEVIPFDVDETGLPIVTFCGIRLKPYPRLNS